MDFPKYKKAWISSFCIVLILSLAAGDNEQFPPGQIFEFSNGTLYYRTFYVDVEGGSLYVGAMDYIFRLDLFNINIVRNNMKLVTPRIPFWLSKDPNMIDYHNHIKVIQPFGQNDDRLYICGSHAIDPRNWIIYKNLTLIADDDIGWDSKGSLIKCSRSLDDNNGISIMVMKNNSNKDPELYTTMSTNSQGDKIPSIFRTVFSNANNNKDTINIESGQWFRESTKFIGSFDVGDQVIFFFNENGTVDDRGVENIVVGDMIIEDGKKTKRPTRLFSRVARVCKKDRGSGKPPIWTSFSKATLECINKTGHNYNNLRSVYKIPDDYYFYALFTTSENGRIESAICSFAIDNIEKAFDGEFKKITYLDGTDESSVTVPPPQPAACSNDSPVSSYPRNSRYVLMETVVSPKGEGPIFNISDVIITKLVVDKFRVNETKSKEYNIYYASSNKGKVYKIVQRIDKKGNMMAKLVGKFDVTPGESIQAMEILDDSLYVASDNRIKQIILPLCKRYQNNPNQCRDDVDCSWWNRKDKICQSRNRRDRREQKPMKKKNNTNRTSSDNEHTSLVSQSSTIRSIVTNQSSTPSPAVEQPPSPKKKPAETISTNLQVNQSHFSRQDETSTANFLADTITAWSKDKPITTDVNANETSLLSAKVFQADSSFTTASTPTITIISTIIDTFTDHNITDTNTYTPTITDTTTPTIVTPNFTATTITQNVTPAVTDTTIPTNIIPNTTPTVMVPSSTLTTISSNSTPSIITLNTTPTITDTTTPTTVTPNSTVTTITQNVTPAVTDTTIPTNIILNTTITTVSGNSTINSITPSFDSTVTDSTTDNTTTVTTSSICSATEKISKHQNIQFTKDYRLLVYITLTAFISVTCCLVLYLILNLIFE